MAPISSLHRCLIIFGMIDCVETIHCVFASIDQPANSLLMEQTIGKCRILVRQTHSHILGPHSGDVASNLEAGTFALR